MTGPSVGDHRLVFIGGLHRSGTTAVARLLAAHSQVSGFSDTGVKEDEGQHLQTVYPPARAHGGAGRFAFSPAAHLTEDAPLVSAETADRLFRQWSVHWDLSRPVLVEKSPPNLVMTRFLQALFPRARFLVVVRHPVVVALATSRWRARIPLRRLLDHWFRAHETFLADAPALHALCVVKYEQLVRAPDAVLGGIAEFLGLDGRIRPDLLQRDRSGVYERRWAELASSRLAWRRRAFARLCEEYEPRARRFGYRLDDLSAVEDFPRGT